MQLVVPATDFGVQQEKHIVKPRHETSLLGKMHKDQVNDLEIRKHHLKDSVVSDPRRFSKNFCEFYEVELNGAVQIVVCVVGVLTEEFAVVLNEAH